MTRQQPDYPRLRSARLKLRPFRRGDRTAVSQLAGARAIADTTISIPHPYPVEQAEAWIARHEAEWRQRQAVHFAMDDALLGLVGAIELRQFEPEHGQAELSFWVGQPYWGHGYAREAVRATMKFGFEVLDFNRIYAYHMVRNPASGRVLAANGFRKEGLLRERVRKWGRFEDVVVCAILRTDVKNSFL